MNFSEFLDVKLNAMMYDRCLFNARGMHRPELAKYHLALLSNTSRERYDIYILKSDILDFSDVNVPIVNGAPVFEFNEDIHKKLRREFYFFEVHSAGVIFTPNFAFERYEECGRYIMNYTKDTRMLDVMFKKLTQEEAAAMGAQPASPIRENAPDTDEKADDPKTEQVQAEEVTETASQPAEEPRAATTATAAESSTVQEIPMLAYDMFCLDMTGTTKKELTEFSYTFMSPVTKQSYEVSVIRSSNKPFEDISVPEKDGKPMIVINRESYEKLTEKPFFFLEAVADGRTQVPNIKFDTVEAAKKYMYNFTGDTRPLDVMFGKISKEDAASMDKQPSVRQENDKNSKVGAIVPPINMSIYTRFCSRITPESKDAYTAYRCVLSPENADRKYALRVLQSNSKSFDAIVIPVANGKRLFELDRTDYDKLTSDDFFYIEATYGDKTGALNKIFKTQDAAESYITMYGSDIRELEVLFKNLSPEQATQMGAIKAVDITEQELEAEANAAEVETDATDEVADGDAKVDFIHVENGERDSSKVQVAMDEDELFEGEAKPRQRRRVTLMTDDADDSNDLSDEDEEEEELSASQPPKRNGDGSYKNKITTDNGKVIYADNVVINVASGVRIEGEDAMYGRVGGEDHTFDFLNEYGDRDHPDELSEFEGEIEDVLRSLGEDIEDIDEYGGLSREDDELIYDLMQGVDDGVYGDDLVSEIFGSSMYHNNDLDDLY